MRRERSRRWLLTVLGFLAIAKLGRACQKVEMVQGRD